MRHRFWFALLPAALALAGCAGEPDPPSLSSPMVTPGPAYPTTPVTSEALPAPPASPGAPTTGVVASAGAAPAGGDPLAANPNAPTAEGTPPARIAPGAQAAGLNGRWTLSANGRSCGLTLQEPPASRAGWISAGGDCGDGFQTAASWTLTGTTLFLYDSNTKPLARLSPIAANRYEGKSAQGAPVTLER